MKVGDLVKVTKHGLRELQHASQLVGLVIKAPEKMRLGNVQVVYVSWSDRQKPSPINVRWLEVVNESR